MSTQLAPTKEKSLPILKQIEGMAPKFAAVLPPHVPVERFVRVCIMAFNQVPDLIKCEPMSVLQSCLTAAQLGLEPDQNLGQCYFVPFNDNQKGVKRCQLIIGYRGFLSLIRNSNDVASFSVHEVYSKDEFKFEFGLEEKLVHIPFMGNDRGDLTHFYGVFRFKDGGHQIEVMTKADVDAIRKKSKMGNKGPWVEHYISMGKKTVIRQMAKYLPQSVYKAAVMDMKQSQGHYALLDDMGDLVVDVTPEMTDDELAKIETGTSRLESFNNTVEAAAVPTVDPNALAALNDTIPAA